MSESALVDDIKSIINTARDARETLHLLFPAIRAEIASDAIPVEDPEPGMSLYRTLTRELESVERRATELFERLCSEPSSRVLRGHLLSYEQFHALRCGGIPLPPVQAWVVAPLSEYDTYVLMHYDDGTVTGWINPKLQADDRTVTGWIDPELQGLKRDGNVDLRFGIAPERVSLAALSPEQVAFFQDWLPAVYSRFQQT